MAGKKNDRLFMWAGGKTRLIPHYTPLLPADITKRTYVEPFAGGAALFNHTSSLGVKDAILSDVNAEIIGLYSLVRDDPEFLIEQMQQREAAWMPLDKAGRKEMYYQLRQEYWDMAEGREATALLYFLMKTAFNGIWQTCVASKGRFGTPVGLANQKTQVFSPDIVRDWSAKLAHTDIKCTGYQHIDVPEGSFVYCDPPYRDSFTSYGTGFSDADQIDLINWCRDIHETTGSIVWLCNRDAHDGFFETHAPDARLDRFPITYTAGRRKKTDTGFEAKSATEMLISWGWPLPKADSTEVIQALQRA